MNTAFITLEVSVPENPADLPEAIETALQQYGDPLRWAITTIVPALAPEPVAHASTPSTGSAKAMVEAIVVSF